MKEFELLLEYEVRIKQSVGDDERAHSLEDEAMSKFIEIASQLGLPQIKKAQAMFKRISEMDFSRWCA